MPAVCPHCRHALPQPAPAACPHCGTALAGNPAAPAPRFARGSGAMPSPMAHGRWIWVAVAGLALLLGLQTLLADREQLAAQARWRPLVERLCGVFGCQVPAWREPAALTMPTVKSGRCRTCPAPCRCRPVPQRCPLGAAVAGAATDLSDADGRVIGSRVFNPREYLGVEADPGLLPRARAARPRSGPRTGRGHGRIHLRLPLSPCAARWHRADARARLDPSAGPPRPALPFHGNHRAEPAPTPRHRSRCAEAAVA
jgi:hypothetical protein